MSTMCSTLLLLAAVLLPVATLAAGVIPDESAECKQYPTPPRNTTYSNATDKIVLWQGIVMLLAFGFFALLVSLIHRLVRSYIYYDSHLLDTFFDAGGDMNFALIACSLVAKWTWTSSITWSAVATQQYGLVGHFWFAAGGAIHLFLFAIVAVEIRIKAPGAKTYLQVVRSRYGGMPHVTLMFYALLCNVLVCGMVLSEGTKVLVHLTNGMETEVTSIILALVVGMFTVVGGVGGGMYVAYFACILLLGVIMYYLTGVYYNPLDSDVLSQDFGSSKAVYDVLKCGTPEGSQDSLFTFLSTNGMTEGVLIIISSFSAVFVDQSYWQSGIAGKPSHSVWGFLTAGVVWFAIPFGASLTLGMPYLSMGIRNGSFPEIGNELIPAYVSHQLFGSIGDFLMFTFTMVAVITTASSEVLAASSIIVYDIYQTYISPFRPKPIVADSNVRMQKQAQNEEYLQYDHRCVILKHVVVICVCIFLIPITLAVTNIAVDLPWLFKFLGVLCGSCVLPVALAVSWHRTTGPGIVIGAVVGMATAVVAWLSYAATLPGGLSSFADNTGSAYAFLIGTTTALGMGGVLCIVVSLSCGGCDKDLLEDEEWEKTRQVDNPVVPWTAKYAPDLGSHDMSKTRLHFYSIRRAFKWSEVSAYILGVLLAVCTVLVWPACMLMLGTFTEHTFATWTLVTTVWVGLALLFVTLVPFVSEVVQTCRQAYYNRTWSHMHGSTTGMARLEEDGSADGSGAAHAAVKQSQHQRNHDAYSTRTESDFQSTIGPQSSAGGKERWKTFIHLK